MRFKMQGRSRGELERIAQPQSNQPEFLPWVLYDTQPYTSGTTVAQTFFANTNADQTLSNIESAASLPEPQFFEMHGITVDFLFTGVSTDAATKGNIDDIYQLLFTQRGTFELKISNKSYGVVPLSFLHGSGGPVGDISSTVATSSQQAANNGVFDGGWYVGGAIVIPPSVNYKVTLSWAAAATLKTSPLNIRVGLLGVLYRRVL